MPPSLHERPARGRLGGLVLFLSGYVFTAAQIVGQEPADRERQEVTFAIVDDGPYFRHSDLLDNLEFELRELLATDFAVSIPPSKVYTGDWTVAGIEAALDAALADSDVDMVLTTGSIGGNMLVRRTSVPRPALAAFVLGPFLGPGLGIDDSTGVENLTYVNAERADRSLDLLIELAGAGPVGLAVPEAAAAFMPNLGADVATLTGRNPADVHVIPVGDNADEALATVDPAIKSVLLGPLPQITDVEWGRFVDGLSARSIATFSWLGEIEVEAGALAGSTPRGFHQQLLRWTALSVQRILLGEQASSLPVQFPPQERLVINMATADRIGLSPTWGLLIAARLINANETSVSRTISLEGMMVEAERTNLELAASDRAVAAGAAQVRLATAPLLPQIGLTAGLNTIDESTAELFPGAAQRTVTGGAGVRQLIFDERVWAARSIEGSIQESRVFDRETLGLDIKNEAGVAYLNVLRAKTLERIERDNLGVTATNLDFARLRVSAGAANLAEVYRWQVQLANNQQRVVDSEVTRSLGELEVNRILDRPLEERFGTEETGLDNPNISGLLDTIEPYIGNPRDFELFRNFITGEALDASPELNTLDALTDAAERALESTGRSFFLPQVALEGGLENRFSESGIGAEEAAQLSRLTWNAALVFSYPLFAGTSRFAAQSQASEELARVEIEREATAQGIDQRVRASLQLLRGSWVKIGLSRAASDAADNNFRLVQDAYRRGVGGVLDLLDAQNEALTTSEAAASAVYEFLVDLLQVERSVGRFEYFGSSEQRAALIERLDMYFRQTSVRQN